MPGGLRGTAAGDEDGAVFAIRGPGPVHMIIGAPPLRVLPETLVVVEVVDRSWVREPLVERADCLGRPGPLFVDCAHHGPSLAPAAMGCNWPKVPYPATRAGICSICCHPHGA